MVTSDKLIVFLWLTLFNFFYKFPRNFSLSVTSDDVLILILLIYVAHFLFVILWKNVKFIEIVNSVENALLINNLHTYNVSITKSILILLVFVLQVFSGNNRQIPYFGTITEIKHLYEC